LTLLIRYRRADKSDCQAALVQPFVCVCFPFAPHHPFLKGAVMALSNRLSSSYRPLLVVVFSLLLVSAYVVNAQNTNNTNTSNVNSAANTNTNVNASSNSNNNTNGNQNGNVNAGSNQGAGATTDVK